MIPTRAQWQKMRDAAKVPQGLTKANFGGLLDAANEFKQGDFKGRYAATAKLRTAALEYYAALKSSKDPNVKAFAPVFDAKVYKEVAKLEQQLKAMAMPTLKLHKYLQLALANIKGVKDAKSWAAFWSEEIRGIGTTIPVVVKTMDAKWGAALRNAFPLKMTSQAYLDKGNKSPADLKACLKEVALSAQQITVFGKAQGWW